MQMLKLVRIGNSVGIVIPKPALKKLQVGEGDLLFLVDTPEGYRITPYNPVFEAQFGVAEYAASRHRNVLRALTD